MSFDVLQEKIIAKQNPTVAGLDARIEYVPEHIRKAAFAQYGVGLKGACEAIWQFNVGLIDALCDVVPAVKPQSAYYENLGWQGMEMLERTIRYAREKGLFVIADIKRGDIGSTAAAVGSNGEILQFTFHRRPTAWTVPDACLFHIVLLAAHRVRRNQHTYWMVTNRAMSSFMAMAAFLAASWKSCPSPPVFFQAHIMPREELTMAPWPFSLKAYFTSSAVPPWAP